MIIVRVELHSAVTGKVTEIGRMAIANDGHGTVTQGNYTGHTVAGRGAPMSPTYIARTAKPLRLGRVDNYPRQRLNVWNLVTRMLTAMGYTE